MKILLLGASGFIGKSIYQKLIHCNHSVTLGIRTPIDATHILCDFAHDSSIALWQERVKGFDMVINAVGIIAQDGNNTFQALHTNTPKALFQACEDMGVKRVIHISALGADQDAKTPYHQSKYQADAFLKSLDLEYIILKPSIVYGEEGKSTALFKALANLPILPIVDDGSQKLQPIHIDDLVATVIQAIQTPKSNFELSLVGDKPITYKVLLEKFRLWLGKKPTVSIKIPESLASMGKILDEPTISKDNLTMLKMGNADNVTPLKDFLGYMPKSMEESIFATPATKSQKLLSDFYFIRPLLRIIIAFVWIWSGIVSAFLYPQEGALILLSDVGIHGVLAVPTLYLASFLDISIGLLILFGFRVLQLLWLSIVVIVGYTLILTLLAPQHWLHPFGPVLKNLPLLVSIYVAIILERTK